MKQKDEPLFRTKNRLGVRELLLKYRSTIVNIFLFATLGHAAVYRAYHAWVAQEFNLVEAVFFTHNVLLVMIILARRQHVAINKNVFHQVVPLLAFFSGIAFDDKPTVQTYLLLGISRGVTVVTLVLGAVSLLNLGRSFGILISVRKIKTGGLYSIIRHPMYFTDILWRMGFVLNNPSVYNFALLAASSAAYVYRALLEEKFLSQFPDYREYMQRVKYRFIPGVF